MTPVRTIIVDVTGATVIYVLIQIISKEVDIYDVLVGIETALVTSKRYVCVISLLKLFP